MADVNRSSNQPTVARTQGQGREVSRRYDFPWTGFGGDLFSMSPFAVMRRLSDEMDRLFGDYSTSYGTSASANTETGRVWSPALEVKQKGDHLVVRAALPGIEPNEVNVEVNDDTLVIQGEHKQEQTSDERGIHRSEFSYGRFYRAIPLPDGAKGDQVKANFNNGVLEVTIPAEERKENRRRIEVQSGSAAPATAARK